MRLPSAAPLLILACLIPARAASAQELPPLADRAVDFEADIRPILAKNCFRCHGAKKQEGGLRLHAKSSALAGGDGGPVIRPGDSAGSRLVRYVAGLDEEMLMPPEGAGDPLEPEQIALLRAWIDQGANWPDEPAAQTSSDHWAFRRAVRPELPQVNDPSWCRNEIDRFVLARLEREGMGPAPQADRATLLRRISLDLIGLPPTPEEVEEFLADERPDAYERLVDRLLASPRYGERWARQWLDHARYADTNGYEKDRERSIWPYRDWVISALNADMPFDRFTIEQLAGDLLPDATTSQRVATGFHRNTMINEEGGIDVEEFRYAALVDRVNTTGTVWLGLSLGCAQCHSHKYDPISQREYYQFLAFFNGADEPEMEVPREDILRARAEAAAKIAELSARRVQEFPGGAEALASKLAEWEAAQTPLTWSTPRPIRLLSRKSATLTFQADGSTLVHGDIPNNDVYEVDLPLESGRVTAIRLEALPHDSLPGDGPGRAPLFSVGDFILTEFEAALAEPGRQEPTRLKFASSAHDYAEKKHGSELAIDGVVDTGWTVKGATGRPHAAVFTLAEPIEGGPGRVLRLTLHQFGIHQMTLGRFRVSLTDAPPPLPRPTLPAGVEATLRIPPGERTSDQQYLVVNHFLSVAPECAEINKQIDAARRSLPQFPTTMVLRERPPAERRVTHIHPRGEFLRRGDVVEPTVLSALHPMPSGAPRNRLGLAQWLVSPENPLTPRVVVNQLWQAHFGRGLVATPEDFGTRGEPPSHPELLDWLATELVKRGWSLKAMHRLIVTSAIYRQSSRVSPEARERDPRNVLLGRGARFRVEAEMVRDIALAASGLLVERLGGPSVYPPQPEGVTALAYGQMAWPTSQGSDRYRRGLYTFTKRTAPFAAFTVMDQPTSEAVCVRRERSNTPLQALTLLNDAAYVEAARALAGRVLAADKSDEARIEYLFLLCLRRPPAPGEVARVRTFLDSERARFAADAQAATRLACDGAEADLAAWVVLCRAILNLDETITRE